MINVESRFCWYFGGIVVFGVVCCVIICLLFLGLDVCFLEFVCLFLLCFLFSLVEESFGDGGILGGWVGLF